MGIDLLLILFGIIGQAASDEGTKVHEVAETCLTIGLVIVAIELLIWLVTALALSRR